MKVKLRRTGGFSSISPPGSGFALRFAKTPSFPGPPCRRGAVVGAKTGSRVTLRSMAGRLPALSCVIASSEGVSEGRPLRIRCLSSSL